jgi:hypothetical protein
VAAKVRRSGAGGQDGDSWIGYDHVRSIRLASISVTGKDGHVRTADELATTAPSGPGAISPGDDALRRGAVIGDVEEDGRKIRVLQGVVAVRGQLLIVTIVLSDDEGWARETYRSITFNADE